MSDACKCLLGKELIFRLVSVDVYVRHNLYYCLEVMQSLVTHKNKRQIAKSYDISISLWHALGSCLKKAVQNSQKISFLSLMLVTKRSICTLLAFYFKKSFFLSHMSFKICLLNQSFSSIDDYKFVEPVFLIHLDTIWNLIYKDKMMKHN